MELTDRGLLLLNPLALVAHLVEALLDRVSPQTRPGPEVPAMADVLEFERRRDRSAAPGPANASRGRR